MNYIVYEVDFETMLKLVQYCEDLQWQEPKNVSIEQSKPQVNMWTLLKAILPGTKWCGVNDLAENYHDLGTGPYFQVDKCCRAHDHCPVKVSPFSASHGVTNYHPYTK